MTAATSTTNIPLELFYRLRRAAAACTIAVERRLPGARFEYNLARHQATLTLPDGSRIDAPLAGHLDYEGAVRAMDAIAQANGVTHGPSAAPEWMTAKEAV